MKFLDQTRTPERKPMGRQLLLCVGALALGILLGAFQKDLDVRQAELPPLLMEIDGRLDLHNFFGGFSPWIVIAVCIAVFSCAPIWAGVKVGSFFVGMVAAYYLYGFYVGGFFPKNYAMIWMALAAVSPILAYLCWYARGKGWLARLISSGILAFLLNTTFAYGQWYIDIRSGLEVLMLLLGILILYKNPKETIFELVLSVPLAMVMQALIPFGF